MARTSLRKNRLKQVFPCSHRKKLRPGGDLKIRIKDRPRLHGDRGDGPFRKPFSLRDEGYSMRPPDGYIEYKRREYCQDVQCPVQLLLDKEVEKSAKFEEIRAICTSSCVHSTHEFHRWLTGKGYLIIRPEQK